MSDLFELRTYTLAVGAMPRFVAASQGALATIMNEYLTATAVFRSEIGPLNQVLSLWRYDSLADRLARRNALQADARWAAEAGPAMGTLVVSQASRLFRSDRSWAPTVASAHPRLFVFGKGRVASPQAWCGSPLDSARECWSIEPFADADAAEIALGARDHPEPMLLLPLPHSPWQ